MGRSNNNCGSNHLPYSFLLLKRWAAKKESKSSHLLQKNIYFPGLAVIVLTALNLTLPLIKPDLDNYVYLGIKHGCQIVLITLSAFLAMRGVTFGKELLLHKYKQEDANDFYAYRKANTKYSLLQQVINVIITVLALFFILITFEGVRKFSSSLLASAGVFGIILGFAAQKSLGTLFSGIQIALAEPIRLDDTVVVEGEFGTIAEINLTFVVVSIWDGRNLIVPISYFLENSFESWTRISPEVITKVKLYADYSLPVDELRQQFNKWTDDSLLWDKRARGFVVTNADEKGIEIRATMSAKNTDESWDLECLIREKLVTYIQENHPEALPKVRYEIENNNDIKS